MTNERKEILMNKLDVLFPHSKMFEENEKIIVVPNVECMIRTKIVDGSMYFLNNSSIASSDPVKLIDCTKENIKENIVKLINDMPLNKDNIELRIDENSIDKYVCDIYAGIQKYLNK